jgi:TusA-related sulfurtransferase
LKGLNRVAKLLQRKDGARGDLTMNCWQSLNAQEEAATARLDITTETCPMTFVRTRLALDRLRAGDLLLVALTGEEPRRNVPRTAAEQGHAVLAEHAAPGGITRLLIRKG